MLHDIILNKLISDKEIIESRLYQYINNPISIETQIDDIVKSHKELTIADAAINNWRLFIANLED